MPTPRPSPSPPAPARPFWPLADLFRNEAHEGWQPGSIEFGKGLPPVRAAGFGWDVDLSVSANGNPTFDLVVKVTQNEGSRRLSARSRWTLRKFLETVELKMGSLGYRGSFSVSLGRYHAHFEKSVKTTAAVRREIERLSSLQFGRRASPTRSASDTPFVARRPLLR